jgi:hypothetical protein
MGISSNELESKLSTPKLSEYRHHYGTTVFALSLPGEKAIATWNDLRKSAPAVGYWPVVFGDSKNLQRIAEVFGSEHAENASEALQQGLALDVQEYFTRRAEEFSGEGAHGEWPKNAPGQDDFIVPRNILNLEEFHKRVDIGLVPAQNSWEVPAYLSFGGWNDCPHPHEQVAVLHYWNEIYGAELVCLSSDVMEMKVTRRPASKEEALKLAREQYWFCYDIVEQGVGTIENLAAALLTSGVWYFWWD